MSSINIDLSFILGLLTAAAVAYLLMPTYVNFIESLFGSARNIVEAGVPINSLGLWVTFFLTTIVYLGLCLIVGDLVSRIAMKIL